MTNKKELELLKQVQQNISDKNNEVLSSEGGDQIIASERDAEIFFNALLNPSEPNDALKKAAEDYKNGFRD
jgi:uncharacterized protein (DUF1778 family)